MPEDIDCVLFILSGSETLMSRYHFLYKLRAITNYTKN